ncbi:SIS domain-containing protein [Acidisoma cellulosilytica]|uniref:SIS domain-containing protein n=1 Tax=Acidisoma cellulosilyticum TaxID=2802395 RepID=A0A963Z3D0_9PROT|nr:SIS domain-containing protein [Acidisoma cellulosilyticum]MCB8881232.1 SIS domain-containing protein [Acidisoma cellulosilyticum]
MTEAAFSYLALAADALATLHQGQENAFDAAAGAITQALVADRLIYLFGTGHSHMLAEEGHYRAGGVAAVVPVLSPVLMLHEGAVESTRRERETGIAAEVLSRYPIAAGDVLIIFSNSGVNAVPVEAAAYGRDKGAVVIAVTSDAYSKAAAAGRPRLFDLADIAIDNRTVPGDAGFQAAEGQPNVGPLSTVIGAAILNALLAEAVARMATQGLEAPIYVSANMPGAKERNAMLVARYQTRNQHL